MWFDELIGYFSPISAEKRMKARKRIDFMRSYDGATKGRRGVGWKASGASANAEIRPALNTLRNRSREIVRNNPYGNRAINLISTNMVGKGILPNISHENDSIEKQINALWNGWASSTACDFEGKHNFYGLQKLVCHAMAESGEVLIRQRTPVSGDDLSIPLKLQVLEADFLISDEFTKNESTGKRKNRPAEITAYVVFCRAEMAGAPIAIYHAHRRERMTLIMQITAQILAHSITAQVNPVIFDRAFLPGGQVLPGMVYWAGERRI